MLDVGGHVGGDADGEGAHGGVGHEGEGDDVFVPGGDEGEQTTIVCALPLYHIYALTVCALMAIRLGGMNVLIPNPRDMAGFVKELAKYQVNSFPAVNTLYNGLLHHPDFKKIDFSKLKISNGGGMAVQRAVAERWKNVRGCTLIEAYGLTETSPPVYPGDLVVKEDKGVVVRLNEIADVVQLGGAPDHTGARECGSRRVFAEVDGAFAEFPLIPAAPEAFWRFSAAARRPSYVGLMNSFVGPAAAMTIARASTNPTTAPAACA